MILEQGRLSGIGNYTVQLAKYFGAFNESIGMQHRVLVFCRPKAAHHVEAIAGIEVRKAPKDGGRITRVVTEQVYLPWYLRTQRVDVLLNPAFTGPIWGARRIITTIQDLYFRVVPELLPKAQRRFLSAFVPICCGCSDRVITTSASTMQDLIRFYPSLEGKIDVVPLASRFNISSEVQIENAPSAPFVLLVAAVTGNKNPEPLIAAIERLRRRYPDLGLVHIGSDPNQHMAGAIARHNAENWVIRRSTVSDADLVDAYGQCLCVAIPSLYEGFGLPLLEAQALGAPVISSNRGSLPEVGGEGALYVNPIDVTEIAGAIETLLIDAKCRQALRRAGFANQKRFSWERTARMTWDILLTEEPD
jgi:glycosyltransferase involved in cell wall biosynthesis